MPIATINANNTVVRHAPATSTCVITGHSTSGRQRALTG